MQQGDLMSPLLFVLAMEYLSMCLKRRIPETFVFHYGCKNQRLNHLIFVDDLFIFYGLDLL